MLIPAIPIILLIMTALVMFVIRLRRIDFPFHWLIAVLGTLLAWSVSLVSFTFLPVEIPVLKWQLLDHLISSGLTFDRVTWIYSFATMTLLLSALLTSAARSGDPDLPRPTWDVLSVATLFTAASLLAIAAGNILTLLITWTVVHLFEITLWLLHLDGQNENERLGIDFALRFVSLGCLIWAMVVSLSRDLPLEVSSLGKDITSILILGIALRLGIFPPFRVSTEKVTLPNISESVLRLIVLAPGLTLLTRVSGIGIDPTIATLFLILICLAALYAGFSWMSAPVHRSAPINPSASANRGSPADQSALAGWTGSEERTNLPNWSIGWGALCLTAAIYTAPEASMAWGITLLLAGGFIYHFKVRPRRLRPILFVCVFALTSLPFTPTWPGTLMFTPIRWVVFFLLLSQSLLISGYLLFGMQAGPMFVGPERWVWALYIGGLAIIPISLYLLAWSGLSGEPGVELEIDKIERIIPAALVVLISTFAIYLQRRQPAIIGSSALRLKAFFEFSWIYHLSKQLIRPFRGLFVIANNLLEGQAGILWAFLLLVLFISLVTKSLIGG